MTSGLPTSRTSGTFGDRIKYAVLTEVFCHLPARVTAMYGKGPLGTSMMPPTVDLEITITNARSLGDGEEGKDGEEVRNDPTYGRIAVKAYPPLLRIPIAYYGSPEMRLVGPVHVGDEGFVSFCGRTLDAWKVRLKGGQPPMDPGYPRFHNLADGWYMPGTAWASGDLGTDAAAPGSPWRLARDDNAVALEYGPLTATLRAATVSLGRSTPRLPVARKTDKVAPTGPFATWLAAVGAGSGAGPPPPGSFAVISEGSLEVEAS